jgi:hypothetical protein
MLRGRRINRGANKMVMGRVLMEAPRVSVGGAETGAERL